MTVEDTGWINSWQKIFKMIRKVEMGTDTLMKKFFRKIIKIVDTNSVILYIELGVANQ